MKHEVIDEKENIKIVPDCQDALLQVRQIQPDDSNLINLWKETFQARNRGSSIANYYEEYPILKTSIGSTLVINILTFNNLIMQFIN